MAMQTGCTKVVACIAGGLLAALATSAARAHCDTMDGPVVKDAQAALEKGDVTGVLKWVPKASEQELRTAFAKTLAVRTKGDDAKELADTYFFETVVRLHRAGEGEPYTGLKPAGQGISPVVVEADNALEEGNVDDLAKRTASAVEQAIRTRFAEAAEARKRKNESTQAGRKFVAAYVRFVHFVEAIHQALGGHDDDHAQGEAQAKTLPAAGPVRASSHEHDKH